MKRPKQLTLAVDPDPLPTTLRDPIYAGYAWGPKDRPADVAVSVLEKYRRRTSRNPREVICHPSAADVIAAEVGGIPVIGTGRALRVLLLGPIEQ
jgi:hypothetical protein